MVNHALRAGEESLIPETKTETEVVGLGSMDALMAQYQPRLFRYFLMNLRDEDAARSLTQDTFVKAWRSQASFRGECAPGTWLMRIAINVLRDHVRGGKYKFWRKVAGESVDVAAIAEVLPSGERGAERALLARERVAQVWRVVETLSEKQKAVFLLRHVEEMELQEIAVSMGLPLPTVKTHLYRALERVRNGIKEGA